MQQGQREQRSGRERSYFLPLEWKRGRGTSIYDVHPISGLLTPSPPCHCLKSAYFVPFVFFLGTPSPHRLRTSYMDAPKEGGVNFLYFSLSISLSLFLSLLKKAVVRFHLVPRKTNFFLGSMEGCRCYGHVEFAVLCIPLVRSTDVRSFICMFC